MPKVNLEDSSNPAPHTPGSKCTDAALHDSELRYRRLFEAAQDGILILEAQNGIIVDANPFILNLLGFSLEQLAGKKLWEIGAFADVFANKEKFKQIQDTGYARYEGLPLVASDGRKLFVEFVSNTYTVGDSRVIQCNIRDNTDLTRARGELTESKTILDMVVENVPLMIFLKEAKNLRYALFNRAGEDLLGYDRKELVGRSDLDFFPPEQAASFMAKDREVLEGKAGYFDIPEEPILTAGKGTRLLHTQKVCVRDKDGVTQYLLGISEDITERKQAEVALRKSEARYRSYIELTGQIGWVTNPAGEIEEDVPSLRNFTGQTYEEAKGAGWAKALHPEDFERALHMWKDSVAAKKPYEIEYRMRRHDGVYRNLLVRSAPAFKPDGGIREWIGTCVDITGRIQAETILRASVEELNTMAEAMPQIVWITRPDGWNIFFNKRWMDYTGLTLEESYGHGWNKPFHPDDQQRAREAWQKATAEHGIYSIESRLRRADGVYRWWLVRGVPLLDADGNIVKWYGTCTDIHDLKMSEREREEMQSQLKQSQKMDSVGQLAGGVAHDFNNLLTAIIGYGGFLMKELAETDPKREDVKEILTAAERAAGPTRQLLAFSRKQILKTEVADLNLVVGGIGKMLRRLIGEDIKLEIKLATSPCQVQVDVGQIEQVLVNLAVNARDAMPKGGTLVLETVLLEAGEDFLLKHPAFAPGPLVCINIYDTGCGMTDRTKEHLFEPFFTTKEKGKGAGLGLSTAFGIVKQSGGEIEVESAPESGTTFHIYIPYYEATVPEKDPGGERDKNKDTLLPGSETILLVEDEDSLRHLGERLLHMSGYTVISAANGKEALEVMEHHGKMVDLLMTDVVMPGMSGRELATELANRKLIRRTLFMSGYTDDAIIKHGVLEPGLAFIYKPFTVEALSRKLREVLDGPADKAKA